MENDKQNLCTLTGIFESLQDAVLAHNTDFNITHWNPAAAVTFGYKAEEIIGKSIFVLVPESIQEQYTNILKESKSRKSIDLPDTIRVNKIGDKMPVSIIITQLKDEYGNVTGASNIIRVLTFDKQAEDKQAVLSSIIDNSDDAIISKSLEGIITSWNNGAERIFEYTSEEAIGKHIMMLIPGEREAEEDFILSSIKKGERILHFQTTRLSKSGNEIPISLTVSPIKNKDGVTIGISKIARNITAEKLAVERQEMLAAIVESSDDAIISKTLEGIISSWNIGAQKIFGYTESEVIGKHITILIPEYRLNEETQIISSIKKGEKVDHFQTTRINKDKREVHISLTVSPIKDFTGKIIGASKIARDITLQKQTEDAIKKNNYKLKVLSDVGRSISEQMSVQAILQKITDATTKITGADFGAFFHYNNQSDEPFTLSVLSGANTQQLLPQLMQNETLLLHDIVTENRLIRVNDINKDERYCDHANNLDIPPGYRPLISYLAVPVKSASGTITGGLFLGHHQPEMFKEDHEDLMESLASQTAIALDNSTLFEEVRELSRKKDDFIAMASHELKTPLTSLSGFLQILNKTETAAAPKIFIAKSLIILEKLNRLIGDLFDSSKIQSGKLQFSFEQFDMVQLINEVIENYTVSQHSHHINFEHSGEVLIEGDKLRLEQVLINLINNAIKYSPSAHQVEIKIENKNDALIVLVKDYGIGIPTESHEHIFSQFYRVDNDNHKISGLGLGLFITREIVERHGGQLMVESELGTGSVFRVSLPVLADNNRI